MANGVKTKKEALYPADLTHDMDFNGVTYPRGYGVMVPRSLAIAVGALEPDEAQAQNPEAWNESLFTPSAAQARIEALSQENASLKVQLTQAQQLAEDQRGAYLGQCEEAQGFQMALLTEQLKTGALQNQVAVLQKQVADSNAKAIPASVEVPAPGSNETLPAEAGTNPEVAQDAPVVAENGDPQMVDAAKADAKADKTVKSATSAVAAQ